MGLFLNNGLIFLLNISKYIPTRELGRGGEWENGLNELTKGFVFLV